MAEEKQMARKSWGAALAAGCVMACLALAFAGPATAQTAPRASRPTVARRHRR